MTENPFAKEGGLPSVSFAVKDPQTGGFTHLPIGTKYKGTVTKLPSKVQATEFGGSSKLYWDPNKKGGKTTVPNDQPIWSVVTHLNIDGKEMALWAQIPSSMFAAIGDAINVAKVPAIEVGGTLEVELVGYKQGEDTTKASAKQYKAVYTPPNQYAVPAAPAAPAPAGPPAPPAPAAPPAPPAPPAPVAPVTVDGFTKEQWIASGYTMAHFGADPKFAPFVAPPAAPPAPPAAPPAPPAPPAAPVAKTITRADADMLGIDDETLAAKGYTIVG